MNICGKCGKPIKIGDGVRHYGTFVAHMEYQCLHLLRDELAAAKDRIAELEYDAERVRAAALSREEPTETETGKDGIWPMKDWS